MSAGVRELSGFWDRISGIKEIRAGLRELRVWEPQRDLEGSKQCFRSVLGSCTYKISACGAVGTTVMNY